VTLSIGYADYVDTDPIVDTLDPADQALYSAKATGRDRVIRAPALRASRETTLHPGGARA
jgi:PleD family two-component response regulator